MLAAPKSLRNLAISIVLQEFDPNSALSRRAFLQTGLRATPNPCLIVLAAVIAARKRPVPFRTRKLRPTAPMVLHSRGCGRVGHRRTTPKTGRGPTPHGAGPPCINPTNYQHGHPTRWPHPFNNHNYSAGVAGSVACGCIVPLPGTGGDQWWAGGVRLRDVEPVFPRP